MALAPFFGTQDPFYSHLDRAFDRAFNRALNTFPGFGMTPSITTGPVMDLFAPVAPMGGVMADEIYVPMDVMEHPNHFEVMADAPGLSPEEVNIEVANGVLTISGRHREKHEQKDQRGRVVRSERTTRQFRRSFALPETATDEGIAAHMDKGVLHVHIPKKPEAPKAQPKRIPIGAGTSGITPAHVTAGTTGTSTGMEGAGVMGGTTTGMEGAGMAGAGTMGGTTAGEMPAAGTTHAGTTHGTTHTTTV